MKEFFITFNNRQVSYANQSTIASLTPCNALYFYEALSNSCCQLVKIFENKTFFLQKFDYFGPTGQISGPGSKSDPGSKSTHLVTLQ